MINTLGALGWFLFVLVTWQMSPHHGEPWLGMLAWFNFGVCATVFCIGVDRWLEDHTVSVFSFVAFRVLIGVALGVPVVWFAVKIISIFV